jgi:transcriptional regulator NrdR family protein
MGEANAKSRPEAETRGLECPRCRCGHFRVIYTRPAQGGRLVRRRECRHCGRRMTTWEKAVG